MDYTEQIFYLLQDQFMNLYSTSAVAQLVYGGLQTGALLVIVFLLAFNTVRRKR